MRCLVGTLLLLGGLALLAPVYGQDQPPGGQPPTPVIKLAVTLGARQPRALRYPLLPPLVDQTPGNAATLWRRAGHAASTNKRKLTDKEYNWGSATETPLKDLPRKEVRALLDDYAATFRSADQAARRDRCDWDLPPITIQTLGDLALEEVQACRNIANLLNLRCRLEIAERRFDDAIHTLQTGFALARHVGEADVLIHHLVGVAIASIMIGRVEELIQTPGAPNLYWSLTVLPQPFLNLRRTMYYELDTIYRSFPSLRELAKRPVTKERADALIDEIFVSMCKVSGETPADWQKKLALATMTTKTYPDARRYLLDQGRTPAEVEALPVMQAVVLYYVDQYDRQRDDILKWASLPYWQGHAGLEQLEKESRAADAAGPAFRNVPIGLLMPAVTKVYQAHMRLERFFAILRCAEAIRLYAATHQGKPPAKLTDITEVPLPIDPYKGKGFEGFYQVQGGTAVLEVPAAAGMPATIGRRFELASVPK
jgi:hypothetical protein